MKNMKTKEGRTFSRIDQNYGRINSREEIERYLESLKKMTPFKPFTKKEKLFLRTTVPNYIWFTENTAECDNCGKIDRKKINPKHCIGGRCPVCGKKSIFRNPERKEYVYNSGMGIIPESVVIDGQKCIAMRWVQVSVTYFKQEQCKKQHIHYDEYFRSINKFGEKEEWYQNTTIAGIDGWQRLKSKIDCYGGYSISTHGEISLRKDTKGTVEFMTSKWPEVSKGTRYENCGVDKYIKEFPADSYYRYIINRFLVDYANDELFRFMAEKGWWNLCNYCLKKNSYISIIKRKGNTLKDRFALTEENFEKFSQLKNPSDKELLQFQKKKKTA